MEGILFLLDNLFKQKFQAVPPYLVQLTAHPILEIVQFDNIGDFIIYPIGYALSTLNL